MSLVLAADYRVPDFDHLFSWFDSAGVEELPPLFVGRLVQAIEI
jgi:hypothetical protein